MQIELIKVEGGTFWMGSETVYKEGRPVHKVTLLGFQIGKYPITQAQWAAVMGSNPSFFKGDDLPVENVSWEDCQVFLKKLNALTGEVYRLPTEAEWEFAARGGNYSKGYKYAGSDDLDEVGWFGVNSSGQTQPVGQKKPNELGIYDMSGNVKEWCEDDSHDDYEGAPVDGSAWVDNPRSAYRVIRGGSWNYNQAVCRAANRDGDYPIFRNYGIGFRIAKTMQSHN